MSIGALQRNVGHVWMLVAASTAFACSAAEDAAIEGDDVAAAEQPIINGTASAAGRAEQQGWVQVLRNGGTCTGTMLRNDLIITAGHCTRQGGTIAGAPDNTMANYQARMGAAANNRAVSEIFRHPTEDVAILQLNDFLPLNGHRFGMTRLIYTGTNASLQGSNLLCYGYGANTITSCTPPAAGAGIGTLRENTIQVSSTSATQLVFAPTAAGQVQWVGDSGGSCISGTSITGIQSTSSCQTMPSLRVTAAQHVAPEAYRVWANGIIANRGSANNHSASAQNTSGHVTRINDPRLNNSPGAFLHVTPNFNPSGFGGTTNNNHIGLWYDTGSQRWTIFNQGTNAMPSGAAFNVWVPRPGGVVVASASTSMPGVPHVARINFGSASVNGDATLRPVVTQVWTGTYNNRAVGVWFDPGTAFWYVYNEDLSAMPTGARFNVSLGGTTSGAFVHTSTAATVSGSTTVLNDPNLNGQPLARMIITHNFRLGGGNGGIFHNHPTGVRYNNTTQRWAIFNQDGAAMPTGITFHVVVRP